MAGLVEYLTCIKYMRRYRWVDLCLHNKAFELCISFDCSNSMGILSYDQKNIDWLINWLIDYCFTSRSRIFHLYGDVTIASWGLQNIGLCSALRAFEQGEICIVPHQLWHGTSVFPVSSEVPPLGRLLQHTRGCRGSVLTWILRGHLSVISRLLRHKDLF
jgi:hypothetical protein